MIKRFTNSEIPKTLYKYREWSNNYHQDLIRKREIFITNPSDFNDPFENIPIRWDLISEEECDNQHYEIFKYIFKDKSEQEIRKIAKEITNSKILLHPSKLSIENPNQIEDWNNKIGILSLSEECDNILMWSHYAKNHTGFVLGFDTNLFLNNSDFDYIENVKYCTEYPIIKSIGENDDFYKKFFHKSNDWQYEKEWRLSKNHIKDRLYVIPKEAITELIIGCKMNNKTKSEIVDIAKNSLGSNLKIYQAKKDIENFKLNINLIEN